MFELELTMLGQFELVGPEEGGYWKVENRWFAMQEGLLVRIREREA